MGFKGSWAGRIGGLEWLELTCMSHAWFELWILLGEGCSAFPSSCGSEGSQRGRPPLDRQMSTVSPSLSSWQLCREGSLGAGKSLVLGIRITWPQLCAYMSLRSLISKMGPLIPALPASLDCRGKTKQMSLEALVWCHVLCPFAVPCLHCARRRTS